MDLTSERTVLSLNPVKSTVPLGAHTTPKTAPSTKEEEKILLMPCIVKLQVAGYRHLCSQLPSNFLWLIILTVN